MDAGSASDLRAFTLPVGSRLALHKHLQPFHSCSACEGNSFSPSQSPCKSHIKNVLQACVLNGKHAHREHCSRMAVTEARNSRKRGVRLCKKPKGNSPHSSNYTNMGPFTGRWLAAAAAFGSQQPLFIQTRVQVPKKAPRSQTNPNP